VECRRMRLLSVWNANASFYQELSRALNSNSDTEECWSQLSDLSLSSKIHSEARPATIFTILKHAPSMDIFSMCGPHDQIWRSTFRDSHSPNNHVLLDGALDGGRAEKLRSITTRARSPATLDSINAAVPRLKNLRSLHIGLPSERSLSFETTLSSLPTLRKLVLFLSTLPEGVPEHLGSALARTTPCLAFLGFEFARLDAATLTVWTIDAPDMQDLLGALRAAFDGGGLARLKTLHGLASYRKWPATRSFSDDAEYISIWAEITVLCASRRIAIK